MEEKRKVARWRNRRIIFNNDGDDVNVAETPHDVHVGLMTRTEGELIDDFLNARIRPLVGTQVNSYWYATTYDGLTFSHHTKLGGFLDRETSKELIDKYGRDNLETQVDFSHKNDMEVFWSLRMNDDHDSMPIHKRRWKYGLAPFKQEHPEYMMGDQHDWQKYPKGPRHGWSRVDFSFPEVREHYFSLIEEVALNYDVDGIELDFFRSYPYFRETLDMLPVERKHLDMMTDLVGRVSKMADEVGKKRGRPLLLAVRTPFTVKDSIFIGLDLENWMKEELIDILVAGGAKESVMTESFNEIVNLGHKYGVPVYPNIDWGFWNYWVFLDVGSEKHRTFESWVKTLYGGHPRDTNKLSYAMIWNSWEGTAAAWRGAAINLLNSNPDGIYVFNGFIGTSTDTWREIGDLKTMEGKNRIYGVDRFEGDSSFKDVQELELPQRKPAKVHFQVGEDVRTGNPSKLKFRLHFWNFSINDDISVKLNDEVVEGLTPKGKNKTLLGGKWLECKLSADQVTRGENRVEIIMEKQDKTIDKPLILDAVQLHVNY